MDIEHLGFRVKSDDSTFEMKIKSEKSIDDKEARELTSKYRKKTIYNGSLHA